LSPAAITWLDKCACGVYVQPGVPHACPASPAAAGATQGPVYPRDIRPPLRQRTGFPGDKTFHLVGDRQTDGTQRCARCGALLLHGEAAGPGCMKVVDGIIVPV
jgi:hypothetical protein